MTTLQTDSLFYTPPVCNNEADEVTAHKEEHEEQNVRVVTDRRERIQRKIEAQNEALEKLYGDSFKRITIEQFKEACPEFMGYVEKYLRQYPTKTGHDKKYLVYEITRKTNEIFYAFELFTSLNKYRFTISPLDNSMRCFVRARKQVVGESWNRCFDLPEGKITEELFATVLFSIVDFETVFIGSL